MDLLNFVEQWWWMGLVVVAVCMGTHFYLEYRRRQKKQFVVLTVGCLITTLTILFYVFSILASMFSILGFFLRFRHH